jgi:hypothetical protein
LIRYHPRRAAAFDKRTAMHLVDIILLLIGCGIVGLVIWLFAGLLVHRR